MRTKTFSGAALGVSLLAAVLVLAGISTAANRLGRRTEQGGVRRSSAPPSAERHSRAQRVAGRTSPKSSTTRGSRCTDRRGCRLLPGRQGEKYLLAGPRCRPRMRVLVTALNRHGRGVARSKMTRAVAGDPLPPGRRHLHHPAPPPPASSVHGPPCFRQPASEWVEPGGAFAWRESARARSTRASRAGGSSTGRVTTRSSRPSLRGM